MEYKKYHPQCITGLKTKSRENHAVNIFNLVYLMKFTCYGVLIYVPYARHYNPRFVYFLPTF